jgi:hypothetical protein
MAIYRAGSQTRNPSLYGGIPSIPQFQEDGQINNRLVSASGDDTDGPIYRYKGLVTYEKPITEFTGDILVPVNAAGSSTTLRAGNELPNNCVGLRFINLVAGVTASINGGGLRTILNNDVISGSEIQFIVIITDATGTVTVQAVGTGD